MAHVEPLLFLRELAPGCSDLAWRPLKSELLFVPQRYRNVCGRQNLRPCSPVNECRGWVECVRFWASRVQSIVTPAWAHRSEGVPRMTPSCLSHCLTVTHSVSPGAGMVVDWEQETGLLMSSGDVRIVRIWDTDRETKVQVTTPGFIKTLHTRAAEAALLFQRS